MIFSFRVTIILRNLKKVAAVSRETPENTKNSQLQNTLDPVLPQKYTSQVSEDIERRITETHSIEFSRPESRFPCALSELDEFLLKPQIRTCSVVVPETSRKNDSESREPSGDPSPGRSLFRSGVLYPSLL